MKYGVAIIGCGDMGKIHATAWAERKDSRILAVFDPDKARGEEMAAKYGAKYCADYRSAIEEKGVSVISVCTPVCLHREISCFAAGAKRHILCEKPIALTEKDADAMIKAARENKVKLAVSYQYRGFPHYRRFQELVKNGEFGGTVFYNFVDIREVRPKPAMHSKSMNGGPVIDMAGHWFDLMRFFTGSEPKMVFANGSVFAKGKQRTAGISDLAVDAAEIQVTMENGHVLRAFVDWGMPEGFQTMQEERLVGPSIAAWTEGGKVFVRRAESTTIFDAKPNPCGPAVRIADLLESIETDRKPEVAGEDGRAALRVSLAALKSIETGQVVELQSSRFQNSECGEVKTF
ncbi:MAG: Gfo/Idh/MocA family oxidoreductase [Victivallales bacterium]